MKFIINVMTVALALAVVFVQPADALFLRRSASKAKSAADRPLSLVASFLSIVTSRLCT